MYTREYITYTLAEVINFINLCSFAVDMFWLFLLKCLYFFLPAYLANMAPVLFKRVPFLGQPIHEGKLGAHKTWRGLIIGTLVGTGVFAIQKYAYLKGFTAWALIDYSGFSLLLGTFLGFGALAGDAFKSYYKRKAGIEPGKPWIPWDQIDFVIGGLILGMFFYVPPASVALILLVVSPLLHVLVNYLGYLLRINKQKI